MKVDTLEDAMTLANMFAPEHLCLLTQDPWALVSNVQAAGGVFVGEHSMEALGDYIAGPSHVMPTRATARFSSAVNVRDFQVVIPIVGLQASALDKIAAPAARMARAEGLDAHAKAIITVAKITVAKITVAKKVIIQPVKNSSKNHSAFHLGCRRLPRCA